MNRDGFLLPCSCDIRRLDIAVRKNWESHIDASHSRQPVVKGERLVRYEVNAVILQEAVEADVCSCGADRKVCPLAAHAYRSPFEHIDTACHVVECTMCSTLACCRVDIAGDMCVWCLSCCTGDLFLPPKHIFSLKPFLSTMQSQKLPADNKHDHDMTGQNWQPVCHRDSSEFCYLGSTIVGEKVGCDCVSKRWSYAA